MKNSKKKLNIAQITPYYYPSIGGVEKVVQYLSEELVQRGHQVTVFTSDRNHKGLPAIKRPREEMINGVKVIRQHSLLNIGHMSFIPQLFLQLWKGRFDIIIPHVYRHPHCEIASLVGMFKNYSTILYGHSPFATNRLTKLKDLSYGPYDKLACIGLFKRVKKVIALTQFEKQQYLRIGVPQKKIIVIPNAASRECFKQYDTEDFLCEHHLKGKKVVLFLGNVNNVKRPDLLIKSLPSIIKQVPNVFLLFVGPDEGMYHQLQQLGSQLKVLDYYSFVGPLYGAGKQRAIASAELLALPSDAEAFGLVLLEAMAHGKPVVCTDTIGPSKIVKNGQTGIVVSRNNVDQLATSIIMLLTDRSLSNKIGVSAKKEVQEKYSVGKVVDALEAVMHECLA